MSEASEEDPPSSISLSQGPKAGVQRISEELQEQAPGEEFRKPKLRNRKFIFKPFVRNSETGSLVHDESGQPVSVVIPEQLAASYGLYLWPCSPVLSWFIWLHQDKFKGKKVLELGAGTALPGLLAAKIGAEKVYLSDRAHEKNVLDNCREAVKLNGLEEKIQVLGISWGNFDRDLFLFSDQGENLDFIIGSDLFFDPSVFEPLCVTLSFLLKRNPKAEVLITLQERSADWTCEEHLLKWNLRGKVIYPKEFLAGTGIEESDLTGKHTIYILQLKYVQDE